MASKWWTLIAVCTGVFMLLLDITIVNVALPDIQRAFGASLSDLQWTIDAYALTLAAFLLTAGSLADLFGRRLLFAIGLSVFTAGSLLCGLASGPLFPVLGGALTSGISWRWIFFVNVPVGIVALLVTLRKVEESRNPFAKRPDLLGFLTFSTALAALTFGLI